MKPILKEHGGFVRCYFKPDRAAEAKIKEETKATVRCIPFAQPGTKGKDVYTRGGDGDAGVIRAGVLNIVHCPGPWSLVPGPLSLVTGHFIRDGGRHAEIDPRQTRSPRVQPGLPPERWALSEEGRQCRLPLATAGRRWPVGGRFQRRA